MNCPACRDGKTHVYDSRSTRPGLIRRNRECIACGYRFRTYEFAYGANDKGDRLTSRKITITRTITEEIGMDDMLAALGYEPEKEGDTDHGND